MRNIIGAHIERGRMSTVDIMTVTILPAIATVCDIRTGKIPNPLIVLGGLGGLLRQMYIAGVSGAAAGLVSGLTILVLLFPVYRVRGLGAGDLKLLAATGIYLTAGQGLMLVAISFLAGGAVALYRVLRNGDMLERLMSLRLYVSECVTMGKLSSYRSLEGDSSYIKFAPCVLCAAMAVAMRELIG